MARDVVYTVLLGGYDPIRPQPVAASSDAEFICFTDNTDIEAGGWRLVKVEPALPGDQVRSQRLLKILGHDALDEYDRSLYIDNTIELKVDPVGILDVWLDGADLALPEHSYRDRLIDEFDEVVALNYDDAPRVHEQLWAYSTHLPQVLEAKPLWTALIARRATDEVRAFQERWARDVLRYSRRDQLSVLAALERSDLRAAALELDNFESELHRWSTSPTRRIADGKSSSMPAGPLAAEIARSASLKDENRSLRAEIETAAQEAQRLQHELAQRNGELEQARGEIAALEERQRLIRAEMADARGRAELAEGAHRSILESTSWRITEPVRRAVTVARRLRGR